jgi:predicted NACHT family NTPase
LFRLAERQPEARWQAVVNEAEPHDARRKDAFTPAFRPPAEERTPDHEPTWRRLNREKLVVGLADPPARWRRVALVCGAGLGKTTNLHWLEAAINRQANFRGKQLAFFLKIRELTDSAADLLQKLCLRLHNQLGRLHSELDRNLELALVRKRQQGRITLLLDSLDQAGADPDDAAVRALQALLGGVWAPCPIWVSGRPHAFKANRALFLDRAIDRWQFVRVGQLDEPECRFLLEDTRAVARRQRQGS